MSSRSKSAEELWSHLGQTQLLGALPLEHVDCLDENCAVLAFRAGQCIAQAGQPAEALYVILEGNARLVVESGTTDAPVSAVCAILGEGDAYGILPVLDEGAYALSLYAMSNVSCKRVPKETFAAELEHHPEVARAVLRYMVRLIREQAGWIQSLL